MDACGRISFVSSQYVGIEELFKDLIPADDEAQLVVYVKGKKMVDASTGISPDALVPIYSVSKALSAIALAHIVDRGLIDLDERVSHYWPEFGSKGKELVTVRELLSHQAGLPDTRNGLTQAEVMSHHRAAALLAAERPLWAPGSAFGYHAITIGTFISELVFRVCDKSVQEYFEDEIRAPLGSDAYLGLPRRLHGRFQPSLPTKLPIEKAHPFSMSAHVFGPFIRSLDSAEESAYLFSPDNLEFGQPAAGGVGNARGLAEIFNWATGYGAGEPGISRETLEDFSQVQVHGYDVVGESPVASFATIFMKPCSAKRFGSLGAFGHDGAAGALLFADPAGEIVFSYVVRRFSHPGGLDPRLLKIIEAIHKVADSGRQTHGYQ